MSRLFEIWHGLAIAQQLSDNEAKIVDELNAAQGKAVEISGYYRPKVDIASKAVRPSKSLNQQLLSS